MLAPALTSQFPVEPVVPAARMLANMRAALALGLPEIGRCRAHGRTLSIAAGGPSLGDTLGSSRGWSSRSMARSASFSTVA